MTNSAVIEGTIVNRTKLTQTTTNKRRVFNIKLKHKENNKVDFHNICLWDELAKTWDNLSINDNILVTGKLNTVTDRSGKPHTEITAIHIECL